MTLSRRQRRPADKSDEPPRMPDELHPYGSTPMIAAMMELIFKPMRAASFAFATVVCVVAQAASPPPAAGENGMVVTAQHLATHVGVDVLKKGGNAIDAAVAVGYALAVTYPSAGNLGGGGFMAVQLAGGRKSFIDFRETAPLAATATMFQDKDGKVFCFVLSFFFFCCCCRFAVFCFWWLL